MIFRQSVPILYSKDVSRSIDYYTQILGFDTNWKWDNPPTFGGVSKDLVEIFFCKGAQGNPGTWLSIMIDKVDAYYETLKSKDAIIHSAPQSMKWGLREMLVGDPDGHYIRFGQGVGSDREKSSELPQSITIIDRKPTVEEYLKLTVAVEWNVKGPPVVEKVLDAVLFAAVAVDSTTNTVAGCILVIGDDATFYYIKDMMVDRAYQGKKIGSALMARVNEWLNSNAESDALVGLYTGENLASFYRHFGFRESFGMSRRIRRTDGRFFM